jgi:hypothetical protein
MSAIYGKYGLTDFQVEYSYHLHWFLNFFIHMNQQCDSLDGAQGMFVNAEIVFFFAPKSHKSGTRSGT